MPIYVWKGRTLAGEAQNGEIDVARAEEAMEILRKKRVFVTSIKPKGSTCAPARAPSSRATSGWRR